MPSGSGPTSPTPSSEPSTSPAPSMLRSVSLKFIFSLNYVGGIIKIDALLIVKINDI